MAKNYLKKCNKMLVNFINSKNGPYVLSFTLASITICVLNVIHNHELVNLYKTEVRSAFFSGFLTVGAFLFSFHAYLISELKTKVFDSKLFEKKFLKSVELDKINHRKKSKDYYDQLERLSSLILISVFLSIVTAFLQYTVGISSNLVTVSLNMFFGIFTGSLFIIVFYFQWMLFKKYFIVLNNEKETKYKGSKEE